MVNKRQTTSTSLSTSLCPNCCQRRLAIAHVQAARVRAEDLLLMATFFVVFLYPLLFDATLLFNLPAWLWWVKGWAGIGLLAWTVVRPLLGLPMAPAQLTGAAADAMVQAAPEKAPILFTPVPVEIECTLSPWRQTPVFVAQETGVRTQVSWRQLWQRPSHRHLLPSAIQHLTLPPAHSPEPSA